ncbi:AbiJ-NTD4 domain-containing protein [Agaribacterium sp. ZY112]|uniref:AbiJ-NTD4 domain-containing protein n=1 Tax=Agaribacterium sp. ZY112 TaxID=3233574 RepID=UPI00352679A3
MKFSERIGKNKVKTGLQLNDINVELRNSLWNVLDVFFWSEDEFLYASYGKAGIEDFSSKLWHFYFKLPMDTRPNHGGEILGEIRKYYFSCEWYEIYDFLEHILKSEKNGRLIQQVNRILESELAGYRFIDSAFVPVTEEQEIEAIESAIAEGPYAGVRSHLQSAIEHLSRKENPDYRNSIKESISAVESMAKELTGNPKATLGDALNQLSRNSNIHQALKAGFSSIYGYTSDEGGIRHAMLEEPSVSVSDAKFFLVSCSSFINYLKEKV